MTTHAAHRLSRALLPSPAAAPRTGTAPPVPHLTRPTTITWRAQLDYAARQPPPPLPGAPHSLQIEITLHPDSRATTRLTLLDASSNPAPLDETAPLSRLIRAAADAHRHPSSLALTLDPDLDLLHATAPGLIAATFRLTRPHTPGAPPTLTLLFASSPLLRATTIPTHAFDGPFIPAADAR